MNRETVLSADRIYRYILWRTTPPDKTYVMFIGLNPSTADETLDDPTIRRCVGFARTWGFDSLCMTNLFAYRATDPKEIPKQDPKAVVGPENDEWIKKAAAGASVIVAAWGKPGNYCWRDVYVQTLLADFEIKCLGTNNDGSPKHPLYLRADTALVDFQKVKTAA